MTKVIETYFNGFSPETFHFLRDLNENNSKAWFEEHRQDYTEYLMEPLKNLVNDLSSFMLEIDSFIEVTPAVNKTISRINRDTRFSRDKSLYKDTMWITFKRPSKEWKSKPAFFIEISPYSYRFGMGYFCAEKETLDHFREVIIQKPNEFLKTISFYPAQGDLVLEGEKYKKSLNTEIPKELQDWHQRKNFYFVCNRELDDRILSKALLEDIIERFTLLAPLYQFLQKLSY